VTGKFTHETFTALCQGIVSRRANETSESSSYGDDYYKLSVILSIRHEVLVKTNYPDEVTYKMNVGGLDENQQYEQHKREVVTLVVNHSEQPFPPAPIIENAVETALNNWKENNKNDRRRDGARD